MRLFPQIIGHEPVLGELFFAAISMSGLEIYEKSKPHFEQNERNIQRDKKISAKLRKDRQRLKQQTFKQAEVYWQDLAELHAWKVFLQEIVPETLAIDIQPILDNIQLSQESRQDIRKVRDDLQAWQDRGTLNGPFDLELFSQVEHAGRKFAELIDKAIIENDRINQLRARLAQQAGAMLNDPSLKLKLGPKDIELLKEVKTKASQPLKPRDLRKIQYNFERVAKTLN
ncbi:MAG: hypothetical protein GF365_01400|nr:hypothetical protein [Candidatus Buchananbacteria bacterium]